MAGSHDVVVLVGPAGSGKSTLAGQITDADSGRTIWLRVALGADTAADLQGLALQAAGIEGEASNDPVAQTESLLELLESEPTTLVIDDYHLAEGLSCDPLLAEVAQFVPSKSRLVVVSRTRPTGLIGRAGSGLVQVIDARELAFTSSETEELLGDRAGEWQQASGGWAAAVGLASESGSSSGAFEDLVRHVFVEDLIPELSSTVEFLAIAPYLDEATVAGIEGVSPASLQRLAQYSALVSESDGSWSFNEVVGEILRRDIPTDTAKLAALRLGRALAEDDPVAAVDLLLRYEAYEQAVDVIAKRLGHVGMDRAVRWVYQLPAELRHQLPPVLTGARATVDLDLAFVEAERRVEEAQTPQQRTHALFGLGSVYAGRGELPQAADVLESSVRGVHDDPALAARMSTELARVRWLSGDRTGTRAALAAGDQSPTAFWLRGMLALVDQDAAQMVALGEEAIVLGETFAAVGGSLLALGTALHGDPESAIPALDVSYSEALTAGGQELGRAALANALVLIAAGRAEEIAPLLDQLERQVGRRDMSYRAFAACLRRAAQLEGNEPERAERRVRDFRALGYQEPQRIVDTFLATTSADSPIKAEGLVVHFIGAFSVTVDGQTLDANAWRTNKAKEVLALLAWQAPGGLRREQAIEYVWPSQDPDKGRTRLRTALSEIRRVLEPDRVTGQASRFVQAQGDRVGVVGCSDVSLAIAKADHHEIFRDLADGLGADIPDADWTSELRQQIQRQLAEAADRVASDDRADDVVAALRVLIELEPWQRSHVDQLVDTLTRAGDEAGAKAAERKWFEDDEFDAQ